MNTALHPTTDNDKVVSVLLIEDVASEQHSIMQAISQRGAITDLNIRTAGSLKAGMRILHNTAVDVVLLDLDLPDSKSLKSISTLLHHFPDIAIVVLSGHSEEALMTEALMMGAQEFLVKGECSGVMIKHTIHQALTRKVVNDKKAEALKKAG